MTAAANATLTAAQWNANIRDNLAETEAAKATVATSHFVSTAANAIAQRTTVAATVMPTENTTSTSYVDLNTAGPAVTATTGTEAIVWIASEIDTGADNAIAKASFAVSGATTIAASDDWAIRSHQYGRTPARKGVAHMVTLTAGANTFTMKYAVGSSFGYFGKREIIVLPF